MTGVWKGLMTAARKGIRTGKSTKKTCPEVKMKENIDFKYYTATGMSSILQTALYVDGTQFPVGKITGFSTMMEALYSSELTRDRKHVEKKYR